MINTNSSKKLIFAKILLSIRGSHLIDVTSYPNVTKIDFW